MKEPLVKNAADPAQVQKASRRQVNLREQELDDFVRIMQTAEGRRFIWRMLDVTGFQKTSFTGNSTTFFNEGQRNIGLMIWSDINEGCPELYVRMLTEAKQKEAENA